MLPATFGIEATARRTRIGTSMPQPRSLLGVRKVEAARRRAVFVDAIKLVAVRSNQAGL